MRNRFLVLLALFVLGTSCTKNVPEPVTSDPALQALETKLVGDTRGEAQSGSLLVKLDESMAESIAEGNSAVINDILGMAGAEDIFPALMVQPKNMEVARKYGLHRWFHISFDEKKPLREVAAKIAASPAVTSIQYNTFLEPIVSDKVMEAPAFALTRSSDGDGNIFDDPYLAHQWNMINTGSVTGALGAAVAGADVGVKDAWRLTAGDPSVIVAVFDCAVNSMHEDLKDALWVNEAEVNGDINVDDDGNGFIDDKYGFNFVGCTKITKDYVDGLLAGQKAEAVKGNLLNWTKGSGHGTHVAGIIGAVNNNGKGVSSIAGGTGNGDGVRLMSCQIFEGTANASDSQAATAFIYAADNGACIAQCSYGNADLITDDESYIKESPLENAALRYFLDPANSNHESLEGNIAVFAAGNHKNPHSSYPGALPYVISVTAFGMDFLPGGYTNYGPGSKIAAPGGEYYNDNNLGRMILSTGVSNAAQASPGIEGNQNYVYMQGTSMACPHVSGVVALGISYAKKIGKKFTREEFQSMLLSSTVEIDGYLESGTKKYYDLSTYTWTDLQLDKYKGNMGTGAVNAWKFLMAIEGTPTLMAETGKKMQIDISRYCNPYDDWTVTVDQATTSSLGLASDPAIRNGKLEIECSQVGSGKITLSGKVGEMPYSCVLSIISRPFATDNGGWL